MFVPVTMELLMGFWKSIQVFALTLLFSIQNPIRSSIVTGTNIDNTSFYDMMMDS